MGANVEWMYSASRTVPWHGIGDVIPEAVDRYEAMRLSHLNFAVQLRDAFVAPELPEDPEERQRVLESTTLAQCLPFGNSHRATVRVNADRTEALLAHVGGDYTPTQNKVLFDLVEGIMQLDSGARYETAGILDDGRRVWVLARLEGQDIVVAEGDKLQAFLLAWNSHDGSECLEIMRSDIRVVCANTLARARWGARDNVFRIRHVPGVETRIEEARRALGFSINYTTAFGELVASLAQVPFTLPQMEQLAVRLHPADDQGNVSRATESARIELQQLFAYEGARTPAIANTGWAAWNAVTERDHKPTRRSSESRFNRIMWGGQAEIRERALRNICDMTGVEIPEVVMPEPEAPAAA